MNTSLLLLVLASAAALKLPKYIKKCSIKDQNFNTCALESAKDALPHLIKGERKYSIPPLEPLKIKQIRIADGNLDVSVRDASILGARNTSLTSISFDFNKKEIVIGAQVPNLTWVGRYNMSGKLLSLPISGEGPMKISFYDCDMKYTTSYNLTKLGKGDVYLVLKDFKLLMVPQGLKIQLDNLFNGNKILGENMNNFINENWKLVLKETGPLMYDAIGKILYAIFSEAAKKVPYKDMFDDTD